jgi:hypothetical protein
MPIKIPGGAKVLTDRRLTLIRILSTLCQDEGRLDQLKTAVKEKMAKADAAFAQSDLVVARLSGGAKPRAFVDPSGLYGLVRSKQITLDQFLSVLSVRTTPLTAILGRDEIERLSKPADGAECASPSLYTEFKPEFSLDLDAVEASILASIEAPA